MYIGDRILNAIDHFAGKVIPDYEKADKQEAIKRAMVMFGYQGANPTAKEIDARINGGGPEFSKMNLSPEEAKKYIDRYQQLADAEDKNQPWVDAYRTAATVDQAAQEGAGPSYQEFVKAALKARIPAIADRLSPRQQADVYNDKALGDPFSANSGVTYNTETGQIGEESTAAQALATLRHGQASTEGFKRKKLQAETGLLGARTSTEANRAGAFDAQAEYAKSRAEGTNLKTRTIQDYLDNQDVSPAQRVDAVNNKQLFKSDWRVHKLADGSTILMEGRPNLKGEYVYSPAVDAQGNPLKTPPKQERKTSMETNTQFLMDTYGITSQAALDLQLMDAVSRNRRLRELADQKNQGAKAKAGGGLLQKFFGGGNQSQPAPVAAPTGNANSVYEQARQAIARGANPAAVRQRLQQNGLDPNKL